MSRNLGTTSCPRCHAPEVTLEEPPRPIFKKEAGRYWEEYKGMLVAKATCPDCEARFLAWCSVPAIWHRHGYQGGPPPLPYHDMSYRSTFNDEPAPEDIPMPKILDRIADPVARAFVARKLGRVDNE